MLKNLFCEDISVEYEFKSVKFKGVVDRLIMNNLDLSGYITDSKHYRRAHVHIDIYWFIYSRWNLSKFVVLKHFGSEFLHEEPCCLDVSIYMLKCVFCWDIVLENEFKRCVYLGPNNHSSRWSLSKFVVSKHLWWESLHGEPCFRLDIPVYML